MSSLPSLETGRISRRALLGGAGAVVFVAGGGLVWRGVRQGAFVQSEGPAYELWRIWDAPRYHGTPLGIALAGMLAANPHNTQPWIFEIGEQDIRLYADERRNLGAFDPYLREMHIGLGCAIENMVRCAPAHGLRAEVLLENGRLTSERTAPAGESLAAHISLIPLAARDIPPPDPLYKAIGTRHTNRGPYVRSRALPDALRDDFMRLADTFPDTRLILFKDGQEHDRLARLVVEATEVIVSDPAMVAASHHWFRTSPAEIAQHRDGVTLDTAGLPPAILMAAKLLPPLPPQTNHDQWFAATRDVHIPSAPALGIIAVRDRRNKINTLRAGGLWQALHLTAQTLGIAMHPINQPVERVDRDSSEGQADSSEGRVLRTLTGPDWEATFVFRFGYPERSAHASPRRSIATAMRNRNTLKT